jgi:hypothetical protein
MGELEGYYGLFGSLNNMFRGLESCPTFKLQTLNLNSNKLHRVVPITLTPTSLVGSTLDYWNNSFSSIIRDFVCRFLDFLWNINYLNLFKNKLFGKIQWSICTMRYLVMLDLSYNKFSGAVPSCLMQPGILISTLMLTNNNFHGMTKNIEVIDLNSYRIQGEIPMGR